MRCMDSVSSDRFFSVTSNVREPYHVLYDYMLHFFQYELHTILVWPSYLSSDSWALCWPLHHNHMRCLSTLKIALSMQKTEIIQIIERIIISQFNLINLQRNVLV
jgi:hypothetical protein